MTIVLNGTNRDDYLFDYSGENLLIFGLSGDDALGGGGGNDNIFGGRGDDTIYASGGVDAYYGGPGDDTYIVETTGGANFTFNEYFDEGFDTVILNTEFTIFTIAENVERVVLNASTKYFYGSSSNDIIDASRLNDHMVIFAGFGDDVIDGTRSDDFIDGGYGADTMRGGAGSDQYFADNVGDRVIDTGKDSARDNVYAQVSFRLGTGVENLSLTSGNNDFGIGNGLDNIIQGNFANNRLDGKKGDDILSGGFGDDKLIGGAGQDNLVGGYGTDVLIGGKGRDTFVWSDIFETGQTARAADEIVKLERGDRIDLTSIDANFNAAGDQSFDFIGKRKFTGDAGDLRYDGEMLVGDVNGDRTGDIYIEVGGKYAILEDVLVL